MNYYCISEKQQKYNLTLLITDHDISAKIKYYVLMDQSNFNRHIMLSISTRKCLLNLKLITVGPQSMIDMQIN